MVKIAPTARVNDIVKDYRPPTRKCTATGSYIKVNQQSEFPSDNLPNLQIIYNA